MADFAAGTGGFILSWLKELFKQVKDTEDSKALSGSVYGVEKKQFPYMLWCRNLSLALAWMCRGSTMGTL